MKWYSATTYASVGNVGPGFDAFGLCLTNPYDQYSVQLISEKKSVISSVTGLDSEKVPTDVSQNCAIIAAEAVLAAVGRKEKVSLKIDRGIPISGGLGSSAAASVGGALATARAIDRGEDSQLILKAALEGEAAIAGRHLDNIAPSLLGGLTVVLDISPPNIQKFIVKKEQWSLVFAKPNFEVKTKDARNVIPTQATTSEWTKYMAHASASLAHFISGNSIGLKESFRDLFAEPRRKLFIPCFDKVSNLATANNSVGFTISGAGPTMMAIFSNELNAIKYEEAVRNTYPDFLVFQSSINNKGAIES